LTPRYHWFKKGLAAAYAGAIDGAIFSGANILVLTPLVEGSGAEWARKKTTREAARKSINAFVRFYYDEQGSFDNIKGEMQQNPETVPHPNVVETQPQKDTLKIHRVLMRYGEEGYLKKERDSLLEGICTALVEPPRFPQVLSDLKRYHYFDLIVVPLVVVPREDGSSEEIDCNEFL